MEFDSSAAKLVNLVVILAQLVSLSVALPAQLVIASYRLTGPIRSLKNKVLYSFKRIAIPDKWAKNNRNFYLKHSLAQSQLNP